MAQERESALPRTDLDLATRQRLEALIGRDGNQLTEGDKAFLTARRAYLSAAERKDLGITGKNDDATTGGDKFDAMNAAALKDELKARGLAVGGKVDELRARLREADATPA